MCKVEVDIEPFKRLNVLSYWFLGEEGTVSVEIDLRYVTWSVTDNTEANNGREICACATIYDIILSI